MHTTVTKTRFPRRDYRRFLERLARKWTREIRTRTQSGRSVTGAPFKKYSPNTRKTGRVNLLETGSMQKNMRVNVSKRRILISLPNSRDSRIARFHQFGTRRMPARPWLGLAAKQIREGIREARKAIFNELGG